MRNVKLSQKKEKGKYIKKRQNVKNQLQEAERLAREWKARLKEEERNLEMVNFNLFYIIERNLDKE